MAILLDFMHQTNFNINIAETLTKATQCHVTLLRILRAPLERHKKNSTRNFYNLISLSP